MPVYAENEAAWRRCFPVMQELRPHLDEAAFLAAMPVQATQGYRLAFREQDGRVVACVGFREAHFLAWGRVLYVDDLATLASARGQGHASALLQMVVAEARARGCAAVHLDSGHQRFDAHRLYLKTGFRISSHHFSLTL